MSSIYEKIDNRLETFLSTLKRFPLASFSALLITMIFLVLIDHHKYNDPNVIIASKVAFVASLGIVLFPALQLLGRSSIFYLIGVLVLGVYYYCLPPNLDEANQIIFTRHILLWIALFSMILWSPFIFRKSNNDTFWEYAQSIIFGLIIAILFSAIVFGGLAAALYAVEKLFHFNVDSVRYGQLAIIIFGVFGVNFFLSQIPKHPLFMQVRPYSKIKRIFSKNILAPIAIVYFLILYAYTAKILLSMTYPSGTLSWIIVAFSFVAIVSFLFLSPYLKKSSLTQRFIWLAIFLQTIMLGMALWMRVEEYGITYNRYLLALFGLWLVLMSLYFMLFGKAQQKWLFFFATLFILFSQFGTYSAKNISKESQTTRLIKLIETAHPRSEKLDIKKKYEISDGIQYIEDYYGIDTFEHIIPHILKKYKAFKLQADNNMEINPLPYIYHNFSYFATQELGFKFVNKWDYLNQQHLKDIVQEVYYFAATDNKQEHLKIKGYDFLIDFYTYNYEKKKKITIENNLTLHFEREQLVLKEGNRSIFSVKLKDFTKNIFKNSNNQRKLSIEEMTYQHDNNNSRVKIMFRELAIDKNKNIESFDARILLKIKEP